MRFSPLGISCFRVDIRIWVFLLLINLAGATRAYSQAQASTLESPRPTHRTPEEIYGDYGVANVLSGRIYALNYPLIEGNQYHRGEYLMTGELVYDEIVFKAIAIQYDIYRQLVVIKSISKFGIPKIISLDIKKVSSFNLDGLEFINYRDSILAPGIYQSALSGVKSRLLIKRQKQKGSGGISTNAAYSFTSFDTYYVVNNRGTFKLAGKKDLLAAFDDDPQLKSFVRNGKLKFSKDKFEETLIEALTFYESL